jgi:hypothetical protein
MCRPGYRRAQAGFSLVEVAIAVLVLSASVMVMISNQATLVRFAQQARTSWLLLVGGRNALVRLDKEELLRNGRAAPKELVDQSSGALYTYTLKEISEQSAFRDTKNLKLVELTIKRGDRADSFVAGFCELSSSKDSASAIQQLVTQQSGAGQPATGARP